MLIKGDYIAEEIIERSDIPVQCSLSDCSQDKCRYTIVLGKPIQSVYTVKCVSILTYHRSGEISDHHLAHATNFKAIPLTTEMQFHHSSVIYETVHSETRVANSFLLWL